MPDGTPHVPDHRRAEAAAPPSRVTHALAWAVFLLALPLVSLGGLVTSTGAGMAVPDWPNSFGYNMFALPWGRWLGAGAYESGVFQEHGHRLLGTAVGLAAIGLCGWAWLRERAQVLRTLTTLILLAVVVQGVMGGLRVTEMSEAIGFAHGVFGQIVLAAMAAAVLLTGRRWWRPPTTPRRSGAGTTLRRLAQIGLALVFLQLVLGAAMRHDAERNHVTGSGAGLAVPDWPTSYGAAVPPVSDRGLAAANAARAEIDLPPTTLGHVWLHTAHRLGAYTTATVLLSTAGFALYRRRELGGGHVGWPVLVGALVIVQVSLGVATVLLRKPADVATTHQVVGALLLCATAVTALRAMRAFAPATATTRRPEPVSAGQAVAA